MEKRKPSKEEILLIKDNVLRCVLYYRIFEKQKWKDIAKKFNGYSPDCVRQIYRRYIIKYNKK